MEYLALGSVKDLMAKEKANLTMGDLITMARQASAGMLYLAELHVVHRDLALRNILVENSIDGYVVKISDFGLSKIIDNSYYKTDGDIPIKWSAPEVIEYGKYTTKSDVYSFGVTLWEMFNNGRPPYHEVSNDHARILILKGTIFGAPANCPKEMYDLMKRCWARDSMNRPSFRQVYEEISRESADGSSALRLVSNSVKYETSPLGSDHYGKMNALPKKALTPKVDKVVEEEDFYGKMKPVSKKPKGTADIELNKQDSIEEDFYGKMKPIAKSKKNRK